MSNDWVYDIYKMHSKYGVREWVEQKMKEGDTESLRQFLKFRLDFLREELGETEAAFENRDSEEIVDGLIDLCVVAIGTLDAFGVDAYRAWNEVLRANMAKEVGQKETRKNNLGLPDLIKPEGWTGPSHEGNHGKLPQTNDV